MKKILIVDDEQDLLEVIATRLENAGYDVTKAENAQSAFAALEKQCPDVVLLDVMMPDKDGFEVCREMKGKAPALKIIIYTAKVEGVDVDRARQAGADDFTVKTGDLKYLVEAIEKTLAK